MEIEYKESKEFMAEQLRELFCPVGWKSGSYAERLVTAMRNSSHVITAWYGDNLIGLVRSLDDGEAVAFIHYLLVRPEYQKHHIGGSLLTKLLAYYESYLYVKMMPSVLGKVRLPYLRQLHRHGNRPAVRVGITDAAQHIRAGARLFTALCVPGRYLH